MIGGNVSVHAGRAPKTKGFVNSFFCQCEFLALAIKDDAGLSKVVQRLIGPLVDGTTVVFEVISDGSGEVLEEGPSSVQSGQVVVQRQTHGWDVIVFGLPGRTVSDVARADRAVCGVFAKAWLSHGGTQPHLRAETALQGWPDTSCPQRGHATT